MRANTFLLARMARLFGARPLAYYASTLLPGALGVALMTALFAYMLHRFPPGEADPLTLWRSLTAGGKLLVVAGMIFGVWTPILLAARSTCRIAVGEFYNRPVSLMTALADMARFIPAALVYSVVIGFSAMMGSSMLFIPGILFLAFAALVVPASVVESKGIFPTLGRGLSLGVKVFGKTLLVVLGSIALVIAVMALQRIGMDRSDDRTVVLAFRYAKIYIPGLLVLVFANICFTLLYVDACAREAAGRPAAGATG